MAIELDHALAVLQGIKDSADSAMRAIEAAEANRPGMLTDDRDALIRKMRDALEFYANPVIYKPHPHGLAFDNRDLSFKARAVLKEAEEVLGGEEQTGSGGL